MRLNTFMPAFVLGVFGLFAAPIASAQVAVDPYDPDLDDNRLANEWVVSGSIGSAFGDQVDEGDVTFGGTLTYLRNGAFGAEFLAGFAPTLNLANAPTLDSAVNNYMVNAVLAAPLGDNGGFQPFVSAGVGALTIHSQFPGQDEFEDALFDVDDTQLGGNFGGGFMAFADNWGFRTDLRYFTGFGDGDAIPDPDPLDLIDPADFLSDVNFWRANVGVAYRF